MSGCLSLQFGGKTHNCNGMQAAEMRIAQLERRINTLEQYAGVTSQQTESLASNSYLPNSGYAAPLPDSLGNTVIGLQKPKRTQ